jgi:hypothetical protein
MTFDVSSLVYARSPIPGACGVLEACHAAVSLSCVDCGGQFPPERGRSAARSVRIGPGIRVDDRRRIALVTRVSVPDHPPCVKLSLFHPSRMQLADERS